MNLNKQTITYSFIIIFIIITFIHLYKINNKNNNNDKENFADLMEDQNLQGFSVSINSMSQVLFGNTPQNKRSLLSFMDEKVSKAELNDSISDKATKTELNDLISDKATKTELNDIMPSNSIIQYGGEEIPQGWQLCDGAPLIYKDKSSSDPNRFKRDNNGDKINTPSLYNIQLFMPASTQVFFSWTHNFGYGQDSSFDHAWNQSSLYSHHAFHASPNNAYMRINLTSVYEIVGIVIGGGGFRKDPHYVRTFESYVSNVHDPNLLKTYLGSAYSTPNLSVEYCKVNNNQTISKPTWNRTEDIIMFDKGIKGNYFTIKPLTDEHGRFMLRIALLVKPLTKSIIKQPLSTDSF
jgi:hypothetical protein